MSSEAVERFALFGGECAVYVGGSGPDGEAPADAARRARAELEGWHARLTRFEPGSELSRLNADPRLGVPASEQLRDLARAVRWAGEVSGGLVDATLLPELEDAGYAGDFESREALTVASMLAGAPPPRPAAPHPAARWRTVAVDDNRRTVMRPPGVRIDGGGLVKGLAADRVAVALAEHATFAVNCAGDVRIGGTAGAPRAVRVDDPFHGGIAHEVAVRKGGVATSGTSRRAWRGPEGAPRHHLIDPSSGTPCRTGVVQATALASTALEAEVLAKVAVLSGPAAASLPHGGVLILEDGSVRVVEPAPAAG